jgi:AAA domain
LKILTALAQAAQEIKNRLSAEITAIQKQTPEAIRKPACHAGTVVGKLIAGLSGVTQPKTVGTLASLTAAESAHLDKLNGDLAADPARVARQLVALKVRIDAFVVRLDALAKVTTAQTAQALRTKAEAFETARIAARAASDALFGDEPLPNVGSDVWRSLWDAARAYSQREAYPDKSFPVTEDSAVCVLCQQEITSVAASRLNRFEVFVKDESKRREEAAKVTYATALDSFRTARCSLPDLMTMVASIRDELGDDSLGQTVRHAAVSCLWRHRQIDRHHATQPEALYPVALALPLDDLRARAVSLAARAAGLTAERGSEARKKLIAERDELADRKWLGTVRSDVLAEIGRRKQIAALQTAIRDTATNRITTKSTEISEILVTNALRAQFAKEVARLGVADLAIELKQEKSAYGTPRFKVALTRKPNANVGEVLSEGEHRCVALAAFLAELATIDAKSGIVFDDPVSSLDHMHREAVANRLADEGQQRQVIVFTHDIAFLFLLDGACREPERKTHFAIRSISKGQDHPGFCNATPPLKAQPLHSVIESMQTRLNNERIHFDRGDQAAWEQTVRSLQEQLRTTWERAVEEALSPVLKRLANKVTTPGLAKITVITLHDCETMRAAFSRCSALLHSEAAGLNKPLPPPEKIEVEITTIRDWITSIEQRQDATKPV